MTDYVRKQDPLSGAQIIRKEALPSTLGAQTTTQSRKYRLRWWTLGVISLSLLVIMMDEMILNVALPTLQRELGVSASGLQWMVNSYLLAFGGLLLMMGGLSDRFGRARMLQIGLIVFGLSSVVAALANSGVQLITARALMGAGAAMIMPATLAIIVDVFDAEERARAIAIWAALAGIGLALGPLLGGLLLTYFWWGSVFLVNVPIVGVALVAGWYLVPESRDPEAKPLDILGTLLSASAISAIVYVIIAAPAAGWTSPLILVPAAVGLLLGIGFAIHEMRTQYPLLDFAFFRRPRFSTGAGAISLMFLAVTGMLFGLTQYLQFVQGYSPLEAGIRVLPVAAGMIIGAMGSEQLVRRFGTTKVVAGGLLLLAATLPSVLLWELNTAYWVIGITVAVVGFGVGAVMAPSTEAIMGAVPGGEGGRRVGGQRCNPARVRRSRCGGNRLDNVLLVLQPGGRRPGGVACGGSHCGERLPGSGTPDRSVTPRRGGRGTVRGRAGSVHRWLRSSNACGCRQLTRRGGAGGEVHARSAGAAARG